MPDTNGAAPLGLPPGLMRGAAVAQPQQPQVKVPPFPPSQPRPEPKWKSPELRERAAALALVTDRNLKRVSALRATGVTVSAAKIIETKIEVLVDLFCPPDTASGQMKRMAFEEAFESAMGDLLTEIEEQSKDAMENIKSQLRQLLLGGQLPANMNKAQIIEMAAALDMPVPDSFLRA